jgi:hypothetical protein
MTATSNGCRHSSPAVSRNPRNTDKVRMGRKDKTTASMVRTVFRSIGGADGIGAAAVRAITPGINP